MNGTPYLGLLIALDEEDNYAIYGGVEYQPLSYAHGKKEFLNDMAEVEAIGGILVSMPKAGLRIQLIELDEAYTLAEEDGELEALLDEIGLYVYQFGVLGDVEGTIEDLEEAGIYDVDTEFELAGEDEDEEDEEELEENE
jgi:hypothetical protein